MAARNRVWLIFLALAGSFPLWQPFIADFLTIHLAAITTSSQRTQQLRMEQVTMRQFSQGQLDLLLRAAGMENDVFSGEDYHLRQVYCQLFSDKGQETTIKGGEALLSFQQHIVTIVDDVQVVGLDGKYQLHTDALRYLSQYQVLKTATPVHLQGPDGDIRGGSLMYNQRTGDFRVGKRVICQFQ